MPAGLACDPDADIKVVFLGACERAAAGRGARPRPAQPGRVRLSVPSGDMFGHDSVDVLVQSKKGEERVRKPLVLYDSLGSLRVFPLATRAGADSLVAHRAGRPQPRRLYPRR